MRGLRLAHELASQLGEELGRREVLRRGLSTREGQAWLSLAIFQIMTGGEGDQRLWFIVDELDTLRPHDGLKDALARLREFGGRCVLGFQSIAQVSSTDGHGEAQTIVENCSNTLILRCSASENGGTARFASKLIGEREVIRADNLRARKGGFSPNPATR